jgi:hypothetical protein
VTKDKEIEEMRSKERKKEETKRMGPGEGLPTQTPTAEVGPRVAGGREAGGPETGGVGGTVQGTLGGPVEGKGNGRPFSLSWLLN